MVERNLGEATEITITTTTTTGVRTTTSPSHSTTVAAAGFEATSEGVTQGLEIEGGQGLLATDEAAGDEKAAHDETGDRQKNEPCTTVFRCAILRDVVGQPWFTGIRPAVDVLYDACSAPFSKSCLPLQHTK